MTRINVVRSNAENRFLTWGKNSSTLVFAAVLIICSVTIGCSSDKPKPVTADNQISMTQPQSQPQAVPAPTVQPESTPIPKKRVVHRRPATVNYSDKSSGVTFEYPRRYAIETGNAASELLQTSAIPMNFVQPGGLALAAVELPETGFQNTDFSSAFFNVSVNKALTADQCTEFAVPQPKVIVQSESAPAGTLPSNAVTSSEVAKQDSAPATAETKSDPQSAATQTATNIDQTNSVQPNTANPSTDSASNSKLLLGDMELRATEAVSGEGTRQSDSKYFHVFQNGACYEFALNVTTDASGDGLVKHVDRDKVFNRLQQILATVKINPIAAPEVTAEVPAPAAPSEAPAQ
ncbi:MAG: hypothetical protein WA477_06685 [Candidatus Sulfotelmatobacter sp.]